MTTASTSSASILDAQLQTLRAELKQWQRAFAATHGRVPTKEDIKREAFVAAKYKEYDRLRRPVEQRERRAAGTETPRKGRGETGHRRSRSACVEGDGHGDRVGTPTGAKAWRSMTSLGVVAEEEGAEGGVVGPPEMPEQTPVFIRNALGPTPQRDGMVLGIFDGLPAATPSKAAVARPDVRPDDGALAATPSKSVRQRRVDATPQSASKRRLLDVFISTPPLKRNRESGDAAAETPSSTRKAFATPAFLRRHNWPMATLVEEEDGASTGASVGGDAAGGGSMGVGIGRRKKGLVRSLSSIIQNLRRQEEERMEEQWDVLNEIETEGANGGGGGGGAAQDARGFMPREQKEGVVVEDRHAAAVVEAEMPLGPDQDPHHEDPEDEDEGDEEVTGRKPRKKKGQKRTTKRVNMKPVLHRPKKAADLEDGGDPEAEADDAAAGPHDEDDGHARAAKARKAPKDVEETEDEAKGTKKKKISATAHANFRTLKIKNKNSKAKGRGGRFGRR